MTAVKITSVIEKTLTLIAPHLCYGCKLENIVLCEGCVETVVNNEDLHCYRCFRPTAEQALCGQCLRRAPFSAFFVAAEYDGIMERVIHDYKFARVRSAHQPLADILSRALPQVDRCVVTHIPTASPHVRVRGYDHAEYIAKALAQQRGWAHQALLRRHHNLRQLGSTREQRKQQAEAAFGLGTEVDGLTVVLVDDVTTSGATMDAAARVLLSGGAQSVIGAVVTQQRLT